MAMVKMELSLELLEQLLALGPNRTVKGAYVNVPMDTLVLEMMDTEAPEGATYYEPMMHMDGTVEARYR